VNGKIEEIVNTIFPYIGVHSPGEWEKDPFIISPETIGNRIKELLENGKIKPGEQSWHFGSGESILPVVDALLGLQVTVTDRRVWKSRKHCQGIRGRN